MVWGPESTAQMKVDALFQEVGRKAVAQIWTRIAWKKSRHFLGVRLAVRMMSWISSSDTLSISI